MARRTATSIHAFLVLVSLVPPAAVAAEGSAAPSLGIQPSPAAAGLPPNGTWQMTVTAGELLAAGAPDARFAGTQTWSLRDGVGDFRIDFPDGGFTECRATYAVVGDVVRFTYTSGTDCVPTVDDIRWTLEPDGLHVILVANQWGDIGESRALWETHPWTLLAASPAPSAPATS
jgi:hypothetical protein